MAGVFARHRVIDTDTHVTEPADLWTSRVPARWAERVPRVERVGAKDVWLLDGKPVGFPGIFSMAGFPGSFPDFPDTYDDIPRAAWDATARLAHMDGEGIQAQVVYPNVGGFGSGRFLSLGEPELMLACVQAYNDFLAEWCSADPARLVPVMATPFWDVAQTVAEIERAAGLGHRAVLLCSVPQAFGQPVLSHPHWDPVWAAARDAGLSISFHIGAGDLGDLLNDASGMGVRTNFARASALYFMDNSRCIAEIIFGGACHRFPELRFVSVESGAGWIPAFLEGLDWQWQNSGVRREHPEYDLLPSEYFRRQIFGCFWFEQGIAHALQAYPENMLYETDYPHPTCMAPNEATPATHPRDYAEAALGGVPDAVLARVLHDNAAGLYGLE
jgi:predicted TIM-barrel fold metal-dependent hydrolase